ncbi:MAG TPA: hypothetical protein VHG32_12705 [Thermoanaerobaculia bacterium]|nr:hypothetical protein [Thermoanaerobaculia bacterium]
MRRSLREATVVFTCLLLAGPPLASPALADEKEKASFVITMLKTAGTSAAGKGAELAVTAIAGLIYDSNCTAPELSQGDRYICDILGSVSGRSDAAWKAKVDKRLEDISKKLDVLTRGQEAIARELQQTHKTMELEFDQAAQKVQATRAISTIEGVWKKYQAELRPGSNPTKAEMIEFATNIVKEQKLDAALQNLNVALTTKVMDGQPMLRYPLYKWRELKGFSNFRFEGQDVYDFAEKKFMEFRIHQEKAYVMYLWAATVIESKCQLEKAQECRPKLPVSTVAFKRDFERYTAEQLQVFNAAVDWLLLSYGNPHLARPQDPVPPRFEDTVARANFLTASILAPAGKGMWGRVFAMGEAWDGTLQMNCGGKALTVKPALHYTVPAEGNLRYATGQNRDCGPLDWWISTLGNAVYDEVRFSDQWKVFHYSLPDAGVGACTVAEKLPARGVMPWVQGGTAVVQVKTADGRSFPFGSFLGIQRAGGQYALSSGAIWKADPPIHLENNNPGGGRAPDGVLKYTFKNSLVETTGHPAGPWLGILSAGRGEFRAKNSRINIADKIAAWMDKPIRFPEGSGAALNLVQDGNCKNLCRNGDDSGTTLLAYDVENNDSGEQKGHLSGGVAIYLYPDHTATRGRAAGQGILIERHYRSQGTRESAEVKEAFQAGTVKTSPGKLYYLNFLVDFFVETEGKGLDATTWMYRVKLTPQQLFLSKK